MRITCVFYYSDILFINVYMAIYVVFSVFATLRQFRRKTIFVIILSCVFISMALREDNNKDKINTV